MKQLPALFDGLNDVDVYSARRYFEERVVEDGERIIEEGQPATALVCIVEGKFKIEVGGVVVGEASAGQILGEMVLFEDGATSASVTSVGTSRVMRLDRPGYDALRDTLHPMTANIENAALGLLVTRVRRVGDRISKLVVGTPMAPTAPSERFFASITTQFGRGGMFSTNTVDPITTLKKCAPFADAGPEALEAVAPFLKPAAYGPGALICTEAELGDQMFLLDEGEVDVVVQTPGHGIQKVIALGPGSAFGVVSMVGKSARMSSCVARTRSVVQVLDREGWDQLINDPYIAGTTFRRGIIRVLLAQLAYSNAQLADYEQSRHTSALKRAFPG